MKKNFVKKLASVLSLAMVASLVAPAGAASAATTPDLTKRYGNVYEGTSYSYAVKNASGYTVKWSVSGTDFAELTKASGTKTVLTIDTDGAAAAKNDAFTVKAKFYKNGKYVKSRLDNVTLKVSATDVAISTVSDLEKVYVGDSVDFNRTLTPANSTSKTYWTVTDQNGAATTNATINSQGVFTASKDGAYVVVAKVRNSSTGVLRATGVQTVVVKPVAKYTATLESSKEVLKADGAAQSIVTFTLRDKAGAVVTNVANVEVQFASTFGNFAQTRVALQNGVAKLLFTSEYLTSDKIADLTATVIEAADKDAIGIKAATSVILSPNPDAAAETLGASMTGAEASQADRVIVYFNKDVTVNQYLNTAKTAIDPAKATIAVRTDSNNATSGSAVAVTGIAPVAGNSKALQVLLATELTDNANVFVNFVDKTGSVTVDRSVSFKLTDARKPAMLSVTNDGLKKVIVTFSEPVGATALNKANWSIDGQRLDQAVATWGADATVTVGSFNQTTLVDTRNIVTITLGTGKYLTAKTHSVQASNIGDWAFATDTTNRMETQTIDFAIPEDTSKPVATVEVMSPEQYLVTYNKAVSETGLNFTLESKDKTAATWSTSAMNANLAVTKIDDNKFLVETTQDWTVLYNTATTKENYYNDDFRLNIAANAVTNVANGLKSDAATYALLGAMTTPDTTSPVIASIDQVTAGTEYKVTMSEPVKMGTNNEGTTLAQGQTSIPTVTAQFIKSDYSKTVNATVEAAFADSYDKQITVKPAATLEGGNWILVVRSISDDIGNTAASATKEFTVTTTVDNTFKINWAQARLVDASMDTVVIEFNKAVKLSGNVTNALATTNYTLDGKALPLGTQILVDTDGDLVTIYLPDGTLNNTDTPHVLNVSTSILAADNSALANGGELALTFGTVDVH